jgi:hypothetical protein
MPNRGIRLAIALGLALAAIASSELPASAGSQDKPRAGSFAGQEANGDNPLPVSFNVPKKRNRVIHFVGQAETKTGCTNHITGFQAPTGPMHIDSNGHFTATSTNYPQDGVTVTVHGGFTSRIKARGHIAVRVAHVKGCNSSRLFTVQRTQ